MNKNALYVIGFYWLISVAYVMRWNYKQGNLSYGTILVALLAGPALSLFITDCEKKESISEDDKLIEDAIREYMGEGLPDFRHIPPPPQSYHGNNFHVKQKDKLKDFKFFQK